MNSDASPYYGYTGKFLIVDLNKETIETKILSLDIVKRFIGGRGFAIHYLFTHLPANADPLSDSNILVISTGPLTGTLVPSSNRYTIAAKSPLTGLIGYSNAGGHFAPELKYAGYDAIVIHGKADTPKYLVISNSKIELRDATDLWGKDIWETTSAIHKHLNSKKFQILAIGQAGENLVRYAAILNNLSRAAARTGLGAVMGSKNLKAIAVRGTGYISVAKPKRLNELIDSTLTKIYSDPAYPSLANYGTSFLVDLAHQGGGMAAYNNKSGLFPKYDNISSETFRQRYLVKSASCFACPIHCGKYSKIDDGQYAGTKGGSPEYETIICLGSKCGIGNLETIIYANELANRYGIDTISLGDTIAFAMEAYERDLLSKEDTDNLELNWGNEKTLIELIHKVAMRKGFGDLLAEGTMRLSQAIGKKSEDFALHVKGLEPPAYDVRTAKAFGLGWATANRGADHLTALPNFELLGYSPEIGKEWFGSEKAVDPYAWESKAEMVVWHENFGAVVDSAEMCKYTCFSAYAVKPEDMSQFLTFTTGINFSAEEIMEIGERIYNLERLFNCRERKIDNVDYLPLRFIDEEIPDGPAKGQKVELDKMLPIYYSLRGWKNGYPTSKKVRELGLTPYLDDNLGCEN